MIKKVEGLVRRLLPKHNFIRGVSVLVGGTAAAQAVSILASPIKTRLFNPEDYGMVAVYASLVAIIAIVASLRYEMAIPVAENREEAAHLVVLGCGIVLAVAAITGLLAFFFGTWITAKLGTPLLARYLWLLPIGIILAGGYQVFKFWSLRAKRFGEIARTQVRQPIATAAIQILGYKFGGLALLVGNAVGLGIGTTTMARNALSQPEFKSITLAGVKNVAHRYRSFPLFASWAGVFNTTSHQLPPLMLASVFGAGIAGMYNLAHHVLALPAVMIGGAVANVFFSSATKVYREGKLGLLVSKVHDKLAQIAMPPMLVLIISGPELFAFAFGEQWRLAGEIARWLAPSLYMSFVSSSISTVFSTTGRQRQGMAFQFTLLATRLAAITAGAFWFKSVITTIALYSIGSVLCYAWFLYLVAIYATMKKADIATPTIRAFAATAVCVAPLILPKIWADDHFFGAAVLTTSALILIRYFFLAKNFWGAPDLTVNPGRHTPKPPKEAES